jgi:hypothetical protein
MGGNGPHPCKNRKDGPPNFKDKKASGGLLRAALVDHKIENSEKAPPLQRPQGWATQLQRQKSLRRIVENRIG